uniref:Uncharacterized protein n=1 Tax=Arundo donax TaxID=35708 RepID=A0A0A9FDX8_ARUDO
MIAVAKVICGNWSLTQTSRMKEQ